MLRHGLDWSVISYPGSGDSNSRRPRRKGHSLLVKLKQPVGQSLQTELRNADVLFLIHSDVLPVFQMMQDRVNIACSMNIKVNVQFVPVDRFLALSELMQHTALQFSLLLEPHFRIEILHFGLSTPVQVTSQPGVSLVYVELLRPAERPRDRELAMYAHQVKGDTCHHKNAFTATSAHAFVSSM